MKKVSKSIVKLNTEGIKNFILNERKKYIDKVPERFNKLFEIDEFMESGYKSFRMIPKVGFNETYIVYLYGSSMFFNIDNEQWDFITRLSLQTHCGLFVPMYPLAPENCCRETFKMLCKAYSDFAMGIDVKRIVLLGDSSGAGLALSMAMLAWKEGLRKPDQLIMLSPLIDTEFFDKELEEIIENTIDHSERIYFNQALKDFINDYWVKDYAVKTEYTSPYYGDYTDLCDDVVLFSGVEDMFNCYSRAFYKKAKSQSVNTRFFEFEDADHDFIIYEKNEAAQNACGYLADVVSRDYDNSLTDIYPLKLLSDWTKRYPDIIKDEWASKFIYDHKFDFSKLNTKLSEYRNLILAATAAACDAKVKQYIMKFPKCTIVNLGCGLDNMFGRLDNGRIQWYSVDSHNIMSVRRAMYGERDREKTIGRSLLDFSWIDDISCKRNQGVMFVCNDTLSYMRKNDVCELVGKIAERFPNAELVFSVSTSGATDYINFHFKNSIFIKKKKRFSVDDAYRLFNGWSSDYRVMHEEPVMKYLPKTVKVKPSTRFKVAYNRITYNHKIIHVKLGSEAYITNM
ncbi:MAG: alpha/beta hydrolase fold domain-containing protein [Lachnospiraceae bacterium]|nr:alpha/beta hydrolase fold domain-containing protein [Lachnospiraceae bacterium]